MIGKIEKSGSEIRIPDTKQFQTIDMTYNVGIQTTSMASYTAYGLIPPEISVTDYDGKEKYNTLEIKKIIQ